MKFCTHCGKELFDEAVMCPGCGCPQKEQQPSLNTARTINHKQILIIITAVVVLIGAVIGVIGIVSNGRKNAIYEALEGESYTYLDYDSLKVTSLSFEEDKGCKKFQYWSYINDESEYTYNYSIKIADGRVYVMVANKSYEAVITSNNKIVALIDEETGDRYD